jgi:hypothetical protein
MSHSHPKKSKHEHKKLVTRVMTHSTNENAFLTRKQRARNAGKTRKNAGKQA